MTEFKIDPHAIYMTVGPSGCGKSTFIQDFIKKHSKELEGIKTVVISSDEIRREIIGRDVDKYDKEMDFVSKSAFKMLMARLDAYTSYPVNAEIVFLDTTGLSDKFREEVKELAKKNHYKLNPIVFNYKDNNDYYEHAENPEVTSRGLKRLRKDTLVKMNTRNFDRVYRLREKGVDNYKFDFSLFEELKRCELDDDTYFVIGDVHGSLNEFKALLQEKGEFSIENGKIITDDKKIILVGDIIDKGADILGTIDFVYKNRDKIKLVIGNHENLVYKILNGELKRNVISEELQKDYFNSIDMVDGEYLEKFNTLVEESYPFLKGKTFIVTHAPCKNKYLGKIDNKSKRAQRNLAFRDSTEQTFDFIHQEAEHNFPLHMFGHIPVNHTFIKKNKIGIDTGCVDGGKLTGGLINSNMRYPYFVHVDSESSETPKFINLSGSPEQENQEIVMDPIAERRYKSMVRNKVNYLSGTICPADKEEDTLESLEKAFEYYRENGINKVMLQSKYMGSKATIYLGETNEDSMTTSRNGYTVNRLDMSPVYDLLREKHKDMFANGAKTILIDGELMPWAALGRGLIDRSFGVVKEGINREYEFLKETGFWNKIDQLDTEIKDYKDKVNTLNKKEMRKEFGAHYETYREIIKLLPYRVSDEEEKAFIEVYNDQLELYGKDEELHFKPFCLLKVINKDGTEVVEFGKRSNLELYSEVSDDPNWIIVDVNDPEQVRKAREFFAELTVTIEGVVVKPADISFKSTVAPYMKVRNPRYLSIIYGYDYLKEKKYSKLIGGKNIRGKLKRSISQATLGLNLLKIKREDITEDNLDYKRKVLRFIQDERLTEREDPRL